MQGQITAIEAEADEKNEKLLDEDMLRMYIQEALLAKLIRH